VEANLKASKNFTDDVEVGTSHTSLKEER
jgi:hypothetical protein